MKMLKVTDLNKVRQGEELLNTLKLILLVVFDVNDFKDLLGSITMHFIVVVEIKYISEEGLRLHVFKSLAAVFIVLLEDDLDVIHALSLAFHSASSQTVHVLVEDIGRQEVSQEVQADKHKEHEQKRVEIVDVHCWKEYVGEVGRGEQNCHVQVGLFHSSKVDNALEHRPVEVVDGDDEEEDVGEDRQQNGK